MTPRLLRTLTVLLVAHVALAWWSWELRREARALYEDVIHCYAGELVA